MSAAKTKKKAKATKTVAPRTRPAKFTVRLERGDGETRLFWEIRRSKATITTRFGKYLSGGRTVVKECESASAAEKLYAKAVSDKRGEGYTDPAPKDVVGSSGRSGVVAANPELETLIEEDPSDLQRYLIYADWLQQQSDPRGELIVAQHGLATTPRDQSHQVDVLERIEGELLKKFEDDLLGPVLVNYMRLRTHSGSVRGLAWRCGFVRAVRLDLLQGRREAREAIEVLLTHPSGRFLEHVALGPYSFVDVAKALENGPPPRATLRSLAIATPYPSDESITPILKALPHLRYLHVKSGLSPLGIDQIEDLEELSLAWGNPITLTSIGGTSFPRLTKLHLTIAGIDLATIEESLTKILEHMPAVTHLTIRRWLGDFGNVPVSQDPLARIVLALATRRPFERLDLEMALSNEYAASLSAERNELQKIKSLRIPADGVPDKVTRATLSTDLRNLTWIDAPEEKDIANIDAFHHEGMLS